MKIIRETGVMIYVVIMRVALCVFTLGISGFLRAQADDAIGELLCFV